MGILITLGERSGSATASVATFATEG